jgi:hypothetical protein
MLTLHEAHLGERSGPSFAIGLRDEILDLYHTVLHLREQVTFPDVLHHVLVDFVRMVVTAKFLSDVSVYLNIREERDSIPSCRSRRSYSAPADLTRHIA